MKPTASPYPKGWVRVVSVDAQGHIEEQEQPNKIVFMARRLLSGLVANRLRPISYPDFFHPEPDFGTDDHCYHATYIPTDKWFFVKAMSFSKDVPVTGPTLYNRELDGTILENSAGTSRWASLTNVSFPGDSTVRFTSEIGPTATFDSPAGPVEQEGLFGASPNNTGTGIDDFFLFAVVQGSWTIPGGGKLVFDHEIEF